MRFFDSHAHLTVSSTIKQAPQLVERAKKAHVERIANIATDVSSLEAGRALSQQFPEISLVAATTPHDVKEEGESFFPLVEEAARRGQLDAIGETGLDYHYEHSPRKTQKHFLRRYLHLAKEVDLPVVIHCRDAFSDLFAIIDEEYKGGKGVLHCFTGTLEEAREVLSRGWFLSLSGIVTFKRSEELREVAKEVPLAQLLIETDTPYLAPQGKRGQPNEPAYLPLTAECIASMRNMPLEELAEVTYQNGENFFRPL